MSKTETFGQRLKRLREAKGWTHRQLMEESDHYIDADDLRSAGSSVRPDIWPSLLVFKVAKALGVTMDYLYTGVDPIAKVLGSSTPNTPGKRIRQRRDELGWSLQHISEKTRFTGSCWAFYESDELVLDDRNARGVAKALGVTPEWILTGKEPKFPAEPEAPTCPLYRSFGKDVEINCNDDDSLVIVARIGCKRSDSQKILEAIRTGRAVE